jgi:AAA15 family ATPase/GTPase
MLIEFRLTNYRSFGDEQVVSFLPATMQKEYPENIYSENSYLALNAIAVYGANGSGKTNLLKAVMTFHQIIYLSAKNSSTSKLPYDPFLLKQGTDKLPTTFEITFIHQENKYRYGFSYLEDRIINEWLYRKRTGREVPLFIREEDAVDVSSGFKGNQRIVDAAIEATRNNALFLSTCDTLNIEEATEIFQWFKQLIVMDGIRNDEGYTTVNLWKTNEYREKIKDYLSTLQLGFNDIDVIFDADGGYRQVKIITRHSIYTDEGRQSCNYLSMDFNEKESAGTKKVFELSGPILWALANGGVLVIDEIEAQMHPILTLSIIRMFLGKETNPHRAQIIFATHDTNLLSYSSLRRDQIYFAEKNNWESTEIYSLSDFKYMGDTSAERPDKDKEKRYLEGRYGAIPVLTALGLSK